MRQYGLSCRLLRHKYRKSVRKEVIEGEFEEVLAALAPTPGLITIAKAMFRDMWDQLHGAQTASPDALKAELKRLDNLAERPMERILEAEDALVAGYEKRLSATERDRAALRAKIGGSARPPAFRRGLSNGLRLPRKSAGTLAFQPV